MQRLKLNVSIDVDPVEDADLVRHLSRDPTFATRALKTMYASWTSLVGEQGEYSPEQVAEHLDRLVSQRLVVLEQQLATERRLAAERLEAERDRHALETRHLEEHLTLLKDQAVSLNAHLERERAVNQTRAASMSRMTERGKEGEDVVRKMILGALGSNNPHKDVLDTTEAMHESDIHVIDLRTNKRIVLEVKNYGNSSILTSDVQKALSDVNYLYEKYNDSFAGYVFISLRGGRRIPRKGHVTLEVVCGVPVVWLSLDLDSQGYDVTQTLLMKVLALLESASDSGAFPRPIAPPPGASEDEDPSARVWKKNARVLRSWLRHWREEASFLDSLWKSVGVVARQLTAMRKSVKERISRIPTRLPQGCEVGGATDDDDEDEEDSLCDDEASDGAEEGA
jgi:hypothetical protein